MAEAILAKIAGELFHPNSAGSDPNAAPNPEVLAKLETLGHDISAFRAPAWISSSRFTIRRTGRCVLISEILR